MATVYSYDRTATWDSQGKLVCDEDPKDGRPVTHMDSKGYAYCTQHAEQLVRNGRRGVRKLRPQEIKKMEQRHGK